MAFFNMNYTQSKFVNKQVDDYIDLIIFYIRSMTIISNTLQHLSIQSVVLIIFHPTSDSFLSLAVIMY